jgi:hypothetical protein
MSIAAGDDVVHFKLVPGEMRAESAPVDSMDRLSPIVQSLEWSER